MGQQRLVMSNTKLTDKQGKNILRSWPTRSRKLWPTPKDTLYWIRAHPKQLDSNIPCPSLAPPSADKFHTHPDGMWIYFDPNLKYVDIMAVEVCGSQQNFYDKRSRNYPIASSVMLYCSLKWILAKDKFQNDGQIERWKACGSFQNAPTSDLELPVRNLRTLITLPNDLYADFRRQSHPGNEFYCRHSSLKTYNSQSMQRLLKQMTIIGQFGTKK